MIEQNTNYAYKLKYMDKPSFDKVRDLSVRFYRELPQALQDELFDALNRGVDILDSEPQMTAYLFAFGKMHQAKLNHAFGKLPEEFLEQEEINIIDYGCGQALGTMCYADSLRENGYAQKVKTITLIEPSEICLKRAALHASMFFPEAEIKTVNKKFDDLTEDDIVCGEKTSTLHILSNVLDMLDFDLDRFAELVNNRLNGNNLFVCLGPYFNYSDKDDRMIDFCRLLGGNAIYSKVFDKNKFKDSRTWTAHFLCFAVGELSEVLSTEVSREDIENGIKDEYGGVYSRDGKKLLSFLTDSGLETYEIKEGTQVICDRAFCSSSVQQITIPTSVTSIGNEVFKACSSLQQITIPTSVNSIGDDAFNGCSSLPQIIIPASVTSIGKRAFLGCSSLHQIIIPDSITSIGDDAFSYCDSLQQITIPASVTTIGDYAFYDCDSLQQIIIPASVTRIGNNPFCGCENLIIESESTRFIVTNEGLLIDTQCNNIISYIGEDIYITIPNFVMSIGKSAFCGCSSLQQITIPASVTTIGDFAFSECSSLQQIIIPASVTTIEDCAFADCSSLRQITIPASVTTIGEGVFSDCISLQQITIPASVTTIGGGAFGGCRSLQQIIIPASVTTIGDDAFSVCSSLQQIIIPASVTTIGGGAFRGCSSLRQITIPDSVKTIGDGAFSYCDSLQQITIPASVTTIGDYAFYDCDSLQQITIPDSVTSIGESAFSGCSSLQQIIIFASVTRIGNNPFCGCENLIIESESTRFIVTNEGLLIDTQCNNIISYIGEDMYITIPNFVMSIGKSAFCGCSSLHQIIIPDSVTSIGNSAFSGCSSLQQITIPASVTTIGDYAFGGCSSLQQIIIPASVTTIGYGAFRECSSLQQITIPDSVTSIGNYAFDGCRSLQRIIIPKGSAEKFKHLLPMELWDKLCYHEKSEVNSEYEDLDDFPY